MFLSNAKAMVVEPALLTFSVKNSGKREGLVRKTRAILAENENKSTAIYKQEKHDLQDRHAKKDFLIQMAYFDSPTLKKSHEVAQEGSPTRKCNVINLK